MALTLWFEDVFASVNGEVFGIYVSTGGSKCSMVIADWLVCVAKVSGLGLDGDALLVVVFLFIVLL